MELSGRAIKSFAFEDTVHNAKLGDTDKGESSHYTNISEIKKALDQMNITGYDADNNYKAFQKDVDYNYTLTCFDKKDGNVVTDETKPVHYFKVEVNALSDVFRANKCTMTYNTIGDRSSMPTGTTWSFFNEGQLTKYDGDTLKPDDKTDKNSHYDYKNERLLEKQASLDNNNGSYKHDDLNANYNSLSEDTIDGKKVKILFYRLVLNLSANENDPINIEDQLPEGIRYVEGSAKAYFYKDACKQNTNGNNYDLSKHDPTVTVDKNNKMSIHLDAGYGFKDPQKICIDYKIIVLDEGWKATPSDNLNTVNVQKALTNTANWKGKDGATDSQKTVVSKPIETLNKTGKQITEIVDGQVKYKNEFEYSVIVNPTGMDLNANGDTVTLNDKLKFVQDQYNDNPIGGAQAYLELNHVKVYKYDDGKEDYRGEELDSSLYSFSYDETDHKITASLPDQTPCVLVYRYKVDKGNLASLWLSNSVKASNLNQKEEKKEFYSNTSFGRASTFELTVRKVDKDNYTHFFPGASFKMESRDIKNKSWHEEDLSKYVSETFKDKNGTFVTNSNGEINFDELASGTLYRITETKAPDGYKLPTDTHYYVMRLGTKNSSNLSDTEKSDAYTKLDDKVKEEEIPSIEMIHFYGNAGGELLVPNKYKRLTINKSWLNADGTPEKDLSNKSAKMTLYRYPRSTKSAEVTIHVWRPWDVSNGQPGQTKKCVVPRGGKIRAYWYSNESKGIKYVKVDGMPAKKETDQSFSLQDIDQETVIDIYMNGYANEVHVDADPYEAPMKEPDKEIVEKFMFNKTNGWSKTWDNLDQNYIYEVKEDNVPGYTSTIKGNDVTAGTITVGNRKNPDAPKTPETVLPSTGGKGTTMFYAAGVLLISLASFLFIRRYKHLNERR